MPRGKKAQAKTEPSAVDDASEEQQEVEVPVATKAVTKAKGKARGKAATTSTAAAGDDIESHAEEAPAGPEDNNKPEKSAPQKPKGRGRGKQLAEEVETAAVPNQSSSQTSSATNGTGRQNKAAEKKAEEELDEPQQKPVRGRGKKAVEKPSSSDKAADQEALNAEVPADEKKKGRGKGKKPTEVVEEITPVIEKTAGDKKRGGRQKKTAADEEQAVPNEETAGISDEKVEPANTTGKAGRRRKAAVTAAVEQNPEDTELSILNAPASNIEMRKNGQGSRPTTPALPAAHEDDAPTSSATRKGRAGKKTPVVTPQREVAEKPKRGARAAKAITPQKENESAEEQVMEKKRGGRQKKAVQVSDNVEMEDPSEPSTSRQDRKRKDDGVDSKVAKKTLKQK